MENKSMQTPDTRPRPDSERPLDAPFLQFDLDDIVNRLKGEGDWASDKHNAMTLMKNEMMRIVVMVLHQGNEIKMHKAESPISLFVVEGLLRFKLENESFDLKTGGLLTLHKDILHGLEALEETTVLLTMAHTSTS